MSLFNVASVMWLPLAPLLRGTKPINRNNFPGLSQEQGGAQMGLFLVEEGNTNQQEASIT